MGAIALKYTLKQRALDYARRQGADITERKSAVIFNDIADSFFTASYRQITANPNWSSRIQKKHAKVPNTLEMQSSNSSDALLMNIFCHPMIASWKGVSEMLGVSPVDPVFGFKARVKKRGTDGDKTEIDMVIGECFVEAKLTEKDFEDKPTDKVEKYELLSSAFHVDCLEVRNDKYQNYQIIRNLLAAIQHNKDHVLLCDERRPDLVRRYMQTVLCLREVSNRMRCRVRFWQEIRRACGEEFAEFLEAKYGLA
jgi:hypothetical protein